MNSTVQAQDDRGSAVTIADDDPLGLVSEYAARDFVGEFRGPTEWLAAAFAGAGPFGSDAATVVSGYDLHLTAREDTVARVTATYTVVGYFTRLPAYQTVPMCSTTRQLASVLWSLAS